MLFPTVAWKHTGFRVARDTPRWSHNFPERRIWGAS